MRKFIARKSVLRGQRKAYIQELERLEWASAQEIKAYQDQALKAVLTHARDKIPFYKNRSTSNRLEDFQVLTRPEIQTHKEEMIVAAHVDGNNRRYQTSGTTSQPMTFVQSRQHLERGVALNLFFYQWAGMKPGDPFIKIWSNIPAKTAYARFRNKLSAWLRNTTIFDVFSLQAAAFDRHASIIEKIQPKVILSYALPIYELAKHLEKQGRSINFKGAIMSSVSTMTPHMRETVSRVFKCHVFDRYGSREMMDMACDCDHHQGLHVNPMLQIIEILDEQDQACPPGKTGRIVVTQLHNPVMPLIRYDTQDFGTWADEPCSCGRNWPMLRQIDGRAISMFRFRNGGVMSCYFLIHEIVKTFGSEHIKRSQVIQKDYNRYHVKLELYHKDQWDKLDAGRNKLKQVLSEKIEEPATLTYEICDAIPRSPSGKYLQGICQIPEEVQ